jgi:hypothetical protein
MEETNKILLNSVKLPDNVNLTTQIPFALENKNKPVPLNDIDTTVSQFEQFLKERKESSIYRIYGVVKPVVSNPIFNENVKIYVNDTNQISTKVITSSSIFEKDGWIGYYNDEPDLDALQFNDNKSALCDFIPFDPGYDRLRMLDSDGIQNYLLKITYPFENRDIQLVKNTSGITLKDGVPVIEKIPIELNGRLYTGFRTAMNHGLRTDDRVQLLGFTDNTVPNTLNLNSKFYRVFKLGNQKNDQKLRTFVIDVDPSDIDITVGVTTIKRVVRDKPSQYYVRRFKSLTVDYKDYDLYPAAYGVTYYNDDVAAFNFKTDIDVKDFRDNLNRPLSELYLTIVKNDKDSDSTSINTQYWNSTISDLSSSITTNPDGSVRFWTKIVGGYDLENDPEINYNIRSYGDPNYTGSDYYENIDESDEVFDGDIVEYNDNELNERRLESVYHRVNTIYREYLNNIDDSKDNKKEGYLYSPFNLIQIREFSNYINPVVDLQTVIDKYNITNPIEIDALRKSFQIPDYATEIVTNVYKWRELLDIGFIDSSGSGVDYPFESGAHYIHIDKRFYLQRQDPPCEFVVISEELTLGGVDTNNVDQNKFRTLLQDPTFLNYAFYDITSVIQSVGSTDDILEILNYNGNTPIILEVSLADYLGEYELGKRDIAGGCIDLSALKQSDLGDDC